MKATIWSTLDTIRQRRRPRSKAERARFFVSLAGVVALAATLTAVVTATAATPDYEVRLTDAQVQALTEAAASCSALQPARLAGQVMAATAFAPSAEGGVSGLTASEWEVWKPWDDAQPTDERASLLALAHFTCDLIGRIRVARLRDDAWRLAIAAYGSSLSEVLATRGIPARAVEFVANVERYTATYDRLLNTGPAAPVRDPSTTTTAPVATTEPTTSTPTPEKSSAATITATAGTATPPAIATTTTTTTRGGDPGTYVVFAGFPNANHLSLNGAARVANNRLDLTEAPWTTGSAWAATTLSTTKSFTTAFTAEITGMHDGMAFILQADGPDALGEGGAGIGYGAVVPDAFPNTVIRPSVAVEIDVADNSPHGWDPGVPQHLAVTRDGNVAKHYVWADAGFDLTDTQPFSVWIEYDATAHRLSVFISRDKTRPAQPLMTLSIDLRSALGADRAYFGFTAASGYREGRASVLAWSLNSR